MVQKMFEPLKFNCPSDIHAYLLILYQVKRMRSCFDLYISVSFRSWKVIWSSRKTKRYSSSTLYNYRTWLHSYKLHNCIKLFSCLKFYFRSSSLNERTCERIHNMGRVKRKCAFAHAQNVRILINLRMRNVSSAPVLSIDTFYGIKWFLQRTEKALIRLRGTRRLIWTFAVRICPKTHFLITRSYVNKSLFGNIFSEEMAKSG